MAAADHSPDNPAYQQAIRLLFDRINYERTTDIPYLASEFKLQRTRELVRRLGDPQDEIPLVHIAGTKGKGSTAELLAQIGQAAGYKVGKFTSPHLERLEERFTIDGVPCSEAETVRLVEGVRPAVEAMDRACPDNQRLTFFEITTAMAFLYFAQEKVDLGVIEVGLGGRLDSTNVCRPRLSIITSISRDHIKTLGGSLQQIAAEKAGIIKRGVPVVSGVQNDPARQVIAETASRLGAPLWQLGRDFATQRVAADLPSPGLYQQFGFRGGSFCETELEPFRLAMKGDHQVQNASLAVMAALVLREQGFQLPDQAIRQGIAAARLPARIECLSTCPAVIVDVAHNDASAQALAEVVTRHFQTQRSSGGRRFLVYASSSDKQHEEILAPLLPIFDEVRLTRFQENPRSQCPAKLHELATRLLAPQADSPCHLHPPIESAETAFAGALAGLGPDDLLVVTGSFFIAAQFRRYWQEKGVGGVKTHADYLEDNETTPSQLAGQTPP